MKNFIKKLGLASALILLLNSVSQAQLSGKYVIGQGDLINVSVFNVEGKLIFNQQINGNNSLISTQNWNRGVYFIHLESDGKSETRKVIKK